MLMIFPSAVTIIGKHALRVAAESHLPDKPTFWGGTRSLTGWLGMRDGMGDIVS